MTDMTMQEAIATAQDYLDEERLDEADALITRVEKALQAEADADTEDDQDEDDLPRMKKLEGPDNFDSRVSRIKARDGCSATEAMSKARKEFPDAFLQLQQSVRKPSTYEDAVAVEIAKGFSPAVAEMRTLASHGHTLPRSNIGKGIETVTTKFMKNS